MTSVEGGGVVFADYYRCPPHLARVGTQPQLSGTSGYFQFGRSVAFGRCAAATPAAHPTERLPEVLSTVSFEGGVPQLPFDLTEIVTNLRRERYQLNGYGFLEKATSSPASQWLYYTVRPLLGVNVRKHLQKLRLRGWDRIAFPRWPVDLSVDQMMEQVMTALVKAHGQPVPFIWFWPEGARACAMMTHDVEGQAGIDFCEELMNLDDAYGIKSAFQLIPEGWEESWRKTAAKLRGRGFEVNLHDLNHDGLLFADRDEFRRRARRINQFVKEFECQGFRSGAMYREQDWYDAFEFAYDMSVPNAAHLEPQRGGCCTVMPYFVGDILELPLTTTQDYSLFHILNDYSTQLWRQQIDIIREHHGLISVITHPDYLLGQPQRAIYVELLKHLAELRDRERVWVALPGEINAWWRKRSEMRLVSQIDGWRVEGPGAERARVAYASVEHGRVVYTVS